MQLHLGGLEYHVQSTITTKNVNPIGTLTYKDMKKKKENKQAMLEITSILSYVGLDDIKSIDSAKKMWDPLTTIYGGDTNVLRAKDESLIGKFDGMRMQEGENIAQYA